MTKPKTLEQLRTEKERAETQLAQEQQVESRVMRKIVYGSGRNLLQWAA